MTTTTNSRAEMQVKLIDYASDPLEKLYAAFRTCYSSDSPIEVWEKIRTEKISHERVREFIAERLKTGHASPLEQIVFWFAIAGVSRSLSHQFVRHRIGISFEQQSQRYVKFKQDRLAFVMPESWRRAGMEEEFAGLLERTSELYARALKAGIPAEDARFVLPNAAPTNFHVMVNFAEMLHICDLRLCVRAQWEIRRMVAMMRATDKTRAARDRRLPAAQVRRESDGLLRRIARGLAEMPAGPRAPAQVQPLRALRTPRHSQGRGAGRGRVSRGRRERTSVAKKLLLPVNRQSPSILRN